MFTCISFSHTIYKMFVFLMNRLYTFFEYFINIILLNFSAGAYTHFVRQIINLLTYFLSASLD